MTSQAGSELLPCPLSGDMLPGAGASVSEIGLPRSHGGETRWRERERERQRQRETGVLGAPALLAGAAQCTHQARVTPSYHSDLWPSSLTELIPSGLRQAVSTQALPTLQIHE
jgi:hypothetical protein